jgi:hypothetical protein
MTTTERSGLRRAAPLVTALVGEMIARCAVEDDIVAALGLV